MKYPWDYWAAFGIGCLVAMAFGFAIGATFVTSAADYPPHRCFTCGR